MLLLIIQANNACLSEGMSTVINDFGRDAPQVSLDDFLDEVYSDYLDTLTLPGTQGSATTPQYIFKWPKSRDVLSGFL